MKVAAFRLGTDLEPYEKLDFLSKLNNNILYLDPIWHFFLDPDAITLRCHLKFAKKVDQWLIKRSKKGKSFRVKDFDPSKDEYFHIRFVGDELQLVFHDLSLLAIKYPGHVVIREILERMAHICINQVGIHDFKVEAEIYLDMAYSRASLQGKFLGLPKWIHKFIVKKLFI